MQTFVRLVVFGVLLLVASACDQLMPGFGVEVTPEVTPEISNVSLSGEYFLTVSNVVDEYLPETTPPAPEGYKWILVTATVTNTTGPTITVEEGSLYLMDDNQARYVVETPDGATMPSLAGAVVPAGSGVMGLARFAIPEEASPKRLELCLDAGCEQKLGIELPDV